MFPLSHLTSGSMGQELAFVPLPLARTARPAASSSWPRALGPAAPAGGVSAWCREGKTVLSMCVWDAQGGVFQGLMFLCSAGSRDTLVLGGLAKASVSLSTEWEFASLVPSLQGMLGAQFPGTSCSAPSQVCVPSHSTHLAAGGRALWVSTPVTCVSLVQRFALGALSQQ